MCLYCVIRASFAEWYCAILTVAQYYRSEFMHLPYSTNSITHKKNLTIFFAKCCFTRYQFHLSEKQLGSQILCIDLGKLDREQLTAMQWNPQQTNKRKQHVFVKHHASDGLCGVTGSKCRSHGVSMMMSSRRGLICKSYI